MDRPGAADDQHNPHPEAGREGKPQGGLAPGLDLLVDEHEEEESVDGRTVRHRGIYLLPNLFTTDALFAGFYATIAAMRGNYEAAPIAIFVAMVFDRLDGRVARLTNTSSKFGAEYDSLSDMVSFGVAPALVVFGWVDELSYAEWQRTLRAEVDSVFLVTRALWPMLKMRGGSVINFSSAGGPVRRGAHRRQGRGAGGATAW